MIATLESKTGDELVSGFRSLLAGDLGKGEHLNMSLYKSEDGFRLEAYSTGDEGATS